MKLALCAFLSMVFGLVISLHYLVQYIRAGHHLIHDAVQPFGVTSCLTCWFTLIVAFFSAFFRNSAEASGVQKKAASPNTMMVRALLFSLFSDNIVIAGTTCHTAASELLAYIPCYGYGNIVGILSACR